eukprot:433682-Prymnesium_polylepis.1
MPGCGPHFMSDGPDIVFLPPPIVSMPLPLLKAGRETVSDGHKSFALQSAPLVPARNAPRSGFSPGCHTGDGAGAGLRRTRASGAHGPQGNTGLRRKRAPGQHRSQAHTGPRATP